MCKIVSTKMLWLLLLLVICQATFPQESYIRVENKEVKLYYEDEGSGPTIIFIPGWTMTSGFFSKQKAYFKDNYRTIIYDPRSQGKSDKTLANNTYPQHALDLRDIILSLGLSEVTLVGWSSGCLTTYAYLEKFGTDRITKLVCIDEPPKWVGDSSTEWVYGKFDGYRSSLEGLLNNRVADSKGVIEWMLKEPIDSLEKDWMLAEMMQTPDYAALSLFIDGMISDYTDVLRKFGKDIPMLFLLRDNWYDQVKAWLSKNVPMAKAMPISSHAMFWEKPREFNRKLEEFLSR